LGVDSRAFDRISISGIQLIHVKWIPAKKNESLKEYALRLFESVNPPEEYLLMGVSFGGMIAQEWAKVHAPKQLILVSTANSFKEIKPILRIPGKLGLHGLLHPKIATSFSFVTHWLFGVKFKEDRQMLKEILNDTDPKFLRWATGALLNWSSETNTDAIRIHGSHDRIIDPPEKSDYLTSGGHFTIFSDGAEISVYLSKIIAKKKPNVAG